MGLHEYKPIKVAINAISAKVGGGVTGFQFLFPKLGEINCSDEIIVILSPNQKTLRNIIPPHFTVRFAFSGSKHLPLRFIYEQLVLPFLLFRWGVDLLYSAGNITSLLAPCKVFLLVENASPYSNLTLPLRWVDRLRMTLLKMAGYLSMRRANAVRFVSENSCNIFSDKYKFLQDKSIVISHGFSRLSGKQQMYQNDDHFILTVASVAPHKNIETLIAGFVYLVNENHYPGNLLIVGSSEYSREYKKQVEINEVTEEFRARIIFAGEKTPEELSWFYRHADAFALVSLAETFGMPVLEAMGYGAPVIVGRFINKNRLYFNPFYEICGEGALYCDPLNPKDIAKTIHLVLNDKQKREAMISVGRQRSELFKWESVARHMHECFHAVVADIPVARVAQVMSKPNSHA